MTAALKVEGVLPTTSGAVLVKNHLKLVLCFWSVLSLSSGQRNILALFSSCLYVNSFLSKASGYKSLVPTELFVPLRLSRPTVSLMLPVPPLTHVPKCHEGVMRTGPGTFPLLNLLELTLAHQSRLPDSAAEPSCPPAD